MTDFIDTLPDAAMHGKRKSQYRLDLEANPGRWAVYPGKPRSVYQVAMQMSARGAVFEAATRNGVGYIRCVKP